MRYRGFDYFFRFGDGRKIVGFFEFLVDTWDEYDYYVFICRSSYWLFLIMCAQNDWKVDKSKILSDRYVIKEYDLRLKNKRVALIDDTMQSGYALYRVYSKLRQWYPQMDIEPMVVYCGIREIDPLQISRYSEKEKTLIDEFISSIRYVSDASYETLGAFPFYATELVQNVMVPYVVELPFLVNGEYTENEYLNDLTGRPAKERTVMVSSEKFNQLISSENNWHYRDNSYSLPDGQKICCGYFYYSGVELQNIFGDYLVRPIMKCRYELATDNHVKMLFTPFAIFRCMNYEEAKGIALTLYKGTEYENFVQKAQDAIEDYQEEANEKFEVAIYRSIVYFVSEYLARQFSNYVSEFGIILTQNGGLLKNHVSEAFANAVGEMANWKQQQFLKQMSQVRCEYQEGARRHFDRDCQYNYPEGLNRSYRRLYNEVIRRKRQVHTLFSFTLEEMMDFLYKNVNYPSKEALKDCLTGTLLRMLDMSVLGNVLEYNNGIIKRGFRYGENSDVMLPYYNPYIFYALDLRCEQMEREHEIREDEVKRKEMLLFLDYFYFFLERKNYLDIIVEQEDYIEIKNYLQVDWKTMKKIILNKHFLLKESYMNPIVCEEIQEYVQDR